MRMPQKERDRIVENVMCTAFAILAVVAIFDHNPIQIILSILCIMFIRLDINIWIKKPNAPRE